MNSDKIKNFFKNILVSFISLFIILLILEIGLRFTYKSWKLKRKYKDKIKEVFFNHHPKFGWLGIPCIKGIDTNGRDYFYNVSVNKNGYRDTQHNIKKQKNEKRILFLGDSFIWGTGAEFNETIPQKTQEVLKNKYAAINMGIGGFSPDQAYLVYKHEGIKYDPEIVILAIYIGNDIYCNGLSKIEGRYPKPKYILQNNNISLSNVPVPKLKTKQKKHHFAKRLKKKLYIHSALASFLLDNIYNSPALQKFFLKLFFNKANPQKNVHHYEWEFETFIKDNKLKKNYKILEHILKKFKLLTESKNTKFIVIIIPTKTQVIENEFRLACSAFNKDPNDFDRIMPNKLLTKMCNKLKIPFIDFTEKFKTNPDKDKLYFKTNLHWTPLGYSIAAETIAEYIKKYY